MSQSIAAQNKYRNVQHWLLLLKDSLVREGIHVYININININNIRLLQEGSLSHTPSLPPITAMEAARGAIALLLIRSSGRPVLSTKAPLSASSLGLFMHIGRSNDCGIASLCCHLSAINA